MADLNVKQNWCKTIAEIANLYLSIYGKFCILKTAAPLDVHTLNGKQVNFVNKRN